MKKRIAPTTLILVLAAALALPSCADKKCLSESKIRSLYRRAGSLNDTAAFLAGTGVAAGSPLHPLTQDGRYAAYCTQMDAIWEQYSKRDLANIEAWSRKHLGTEEVGTLMYPFSGPDILNALAFFPGADEVVMIGLEKPGSVPDPLNRRAGDLYGELWRIRMSLRTILQLNLFRTLEMAADFRADSFSNITGIMMFFLARYNYEILDIRSIHVVRDGRISYGAGRSGSDAEGVEFVFRRGKGTPVKTARFFSVDLSDASLSRAAGFSSFLGRRKGFTTFIKSASYLLSYDHFTILRSYLLAGSRRIVQDDSGIPYRFFPAVEWSIAFHGTYRVIAMFADRFQPDLNAAMKRKNSGRLTFSFGYGFMPSMSGIMIADKAGWKD